MLNIRENLLDPDFIQPIEFGIVTRSLDGESVEWLVHENTCIQSASGAPLQRLPELERSKPSYDVFTLDTFPLKNGDYLKYKGQTYRCVTQDNFEDYGYYNGIFQLYSGAQDTENPTPDPWA